jgi:nicotinate phosphoribosyltransferase
MMNLSPLVTDLYQLTMMCAYLNSGKTGKAAFELFVRELPKNRNFLVFLGREEILKVVESLRFTPDDIDYLNSLKLFPDWFLDYLKEFEFTGTVYAFKDGELFFPYEPVVRVEAPIHQAQLLETLLMNQLHPLVLIASKAARVVAVSRGRTVVDFSLRRTHGTDAGLKVAKASYAVGFAGTSNVLAGKLYSVPVVGTVAHSFIMAFRSEKEAFRAYLETFPGHSVLIVDTYDPVRGIKRAIEVAKELGVELKGVRIDSGDLVELSKLAREILDREGFRSAKIILSGGLDEYKIDQVLSAGAPVDAFGVGTKVGTSSDAPYVDFVYKLVEVEGRPIMKTSTGKKMYPGRKQVYRDYSTWKDRLTLVTESSPGEPLLEKIVVNGSPVISPPSLSRIRERFIELFSRVPAPLKNIYTQVNWLPEVSEGVLKLYKQLEEELLGG